MRPVKWGVLGAGSRVFARRMIPAFAAAENAELVAVASRRADTARETAAKFGIPRAYASYEDLLADPDIEAVYLPLPNDLHAAWTLSALQAGKHVLCDKPAALNFADAQAMEQAAHSASLRLMEGFMCRFHKQHERVREIIASGEIGVPAHFDGTFTYPADKSAGGIRWNAAQSGGGAFWDVGVYPVNAARFFFGEPDAVFAVSQTDNETQADLHTVAVLEWAGGKTATLRGGFDQAFASRYELSGDAGSIRAERAFQIGESGVNLVTTPNNGESRAEFFAHTDCWAEEIRHFSACIRDASRDLAPGETGTNQARVCEGVVRSAREKRRIELIEIPGI